MIKPTDYPNDVGGIYKITCLENGTVYIGQTSNFRRRVREHIYSLRKGKHRNRQMQEDFDLYGESQFEISILANSSESLDEMEREYIEAARNGSGCYNVFGGGVSGYSVTQEFRDKISRAHKGRVDSEEARRKRSESARRQWHDESYRELMVQSAKRQWRDEEYRAIMRDAHLGKSDACRHKLTAEIVRDMRHRHANGETISALADEYGVTYCAARSAIIADSWKNI